MILYNSTFHFSLELEIFWIDLFTFEKVLDLGSYGSEAAVTKILDVTKQSVLFFSYVPTKTLKLV